MNLCYSKRQALDRTYVSLINVIILLSISSVKQMDFSSPVCLREVKYADPATADGILLVSLLLTLNIFHTLF